MKSYDWPNVRARLREAIRILPHFARNPVVGMRTLPDWDWPTILILQAAFAAITASISHLIERNYVLMLTSIVIAPITHLALVGNSTGLFFYVFKFVFGRDVPYRQIYVNVLFASIPTQITLIVAPLVPPLMLAGSLASSILIYIGFVDNFRLPRKPVRITLGFLFVLYTAFWVAQLVKQNSHHVRLRERATPESMDILEKELNRGDESHDD